MSNLSFTDFNEFFVELETMALTLGHSENDAQLLTTKALDNAVDVPVDLQKSCAKNTMKMMLDEPDVYLD